MLVSRGDGEARRLRGTYAGRALQEGSELQVDVGSASASLDIEVLPIAVSGQVVDAQSGAPVKGAEVRPLARADSEPGPVAAVSDAEGRFALETLWHPTFQVQTAGYSPRVFEVPATPATEVRVGPDPRRPPARDRARRQREAVGRCAR